MSTYPCSKFDCGATFENWCNEQEHDNREVLDNISQTKVDEWNSKGDTLRVIDGELQLLDKSGNKKSGVNLCLSDGITLERDSVSGKMCVIGIKEKNSARVINIWVGSKELYDKTQTVPNPNYLYWITDMSMSEIIGQITRINERLDGEIENRFLTVEDRIGTAEGYIRGLVNTGDFSAKNALKVNNLEIARDENGVLKIGNTIIPQEVVLFEGGFTLGAEKTALPITSLTYNKYNSFKVEFVLDYYGASSGKRKQVALASINNNMLQFSFTEEGIFVYTVSVPVQQVQSWLINCVSLSNEVGDTSVATYIYTNTHNQNNYLNLTIYRVIGIIE